jgi:glycine betaine/choline ABC-type transport system substrate-binding protein
MKKWWSLLPRKEKIEIGILVFTIATCIAAVLTVPGSTDVCQSMWNRIFPAPKAVVIAGMDFPEQYTMGEIIAQMLEARGVKVERNFKQSGELLRSAMEKGTIDCYLEYTGTSYTLQFHQKPIPDQQKIYTYLRDEYSRRNIEISKPFSFQDEWAILIRNRDALKFNLQTISDIVPHAPNWKAGFVPDFRSDPNAAGGLKRTYGLNFKLEREIGLPDIYDELAKGRVDIISGNSTDGDLRKYDFRQLKDDRQHFPPYYPIIVARREALERVPELKEIMEELPGKMTLDEMRRLNYQIVNQHYNLQDIVRGWIKANGFDSPKQTEARVH